MGGKKERGHGFKIIETKESLQAPSLPPPKLPIRREEGSEISRYSPDFGFRESRDLERPSSRVVTEPRGWPVAQPPHTTDTRPGE